MTTESRTKHPESLQELLVEVSREHPNRPAIIAEDGSIIRYKQLADKVSAMALTLERFNVEPGHRVAILLPNGIGFVTAYFAALTAGAITVPLNAQYQQNELLYSLRVCEASVLITSLQFQPLCRKVLLMQQLPVQLLFIEEIQSSSQQLPPLEATVKTPRPGTPAMYQFSSGSTGHPKQIARSHNNLLFELMSLRKTLGLSHLDRFLGVAPFSHVNGLTRSMLASLSCAAVLHPFAKFERQAVIDCIVHYRPTVFIGVPFHFSMLAKAKLGDAPDFSSLRLCISASAPMSRQLNELFHSRFGIYVRQLYGSTETGTISVNLEQNVIASINTVGRPIYGVQVEVLKEDGSVVPIGEVGEFAVKSPAAISSYVDAEETDNQVFRDGWFLTGDLGTRDARGLLTITGRKKFLINKSGYKIDPTEIEHLLDSHPNVDESVVLGVPTKYGDEIVKAVIVVKQKCAAEEILEFCLGKIAPFKIPSQVEFRDSIPKSSTGKVRRALLNKR